MSDLAELFRANGYRVPEVPEPYVFGPGGWLVGKIEADGEYRQVSTTHEPTAVLAKWRAMNQAREALRSAEGVDAYVAARLGKVAESDSFARDLS